MINLHYKYIFLIFLIFSQLNATDIRSLLFHGNCATCHFKTRSHSAPSVMELRQRYLDAFSNKEDFINYMATWVHKPKAETSLMHDAIDKYELMPELGFDLPTLREISAYIYEVDFSKRHEGHK